MSISQCFPTLHCISIQTNSNLNYRVSQGTWEFLDLWSLKLFAAFLVINSIILPLKVGLWIMPQIISKTKDDLQVVLLLSWYLEHPVVLQDYFKLSWNKSPAWNSKQLIQLHLRTHFSIKISDLRKKYKKL